MSPIVRRLCWSLLVAALALFCVHCVISLSWRLSRRIPEPLRELLDMTSETGLFTWLAVMVWALLGAACLVWARLGKSRRWALTGGLFLLLSLDDACMLHERSGHLLSNPTRSDVFPWLFVLGPVFAVLGILVFIHLMTALRDRPGGRKWVITGFGLLALAVALEVLEGPHTRAGWTWRDLPMYRYTQPVEELAELLGPLCLLRAVASPLEARLRRGVATGLASESM